jgi:hypothetical protein
MCGGGRRRTLGHVAQNETEEVDMNVLGAEMKPQGRGFAVAFGVLTAGVAVSLALASYAVTTTGSGGKAIARSSGEASVARVAPLGPSASLPGANAAQLNAYGKALTARHAPTLAPVTLGPSASLPGANTALLNRYGRALTAHR